MSALLDSNSSYRSVAVVRVDWDQHRGSDLVKDLKVTRRSTLIMFKGGKEVGRVVAQTSTAAIEELFKAAT